MAKGFMEKRTDPKWIGNICCSVLWILSLICALLGIIADATTGTLGLTAVPWLLLAIVFHLARLPMAGMSCWIDVYCRAREAKKKE